MPAFRVSGSTGQAPTTVFLGPLADKFTMLLPMHADNNSTHWDSMLNAARHINQWTIFNTSFNGGSNTNSVTLGALTTAPDGTNTGQKLVETTTNSLHGSEAGSLLFQQGAIFRLLVFAKAAERTRIVVYAMDSGIAEGTGGNGVFGGGVKTVFDLAGTQIGVAPVVVGTNGWVAGPANILDFGNNWRLCSMDFTYNNINSIHVDFGIITGVFLDSGAGTAAQSSIYAGDVSKGAFFWNTCMLPRPAYGFIPQVTFFDDFIDNTMAAFDLGNTKAPGFTWYLNNNWPHVGFNSLSPTNPAALSVSGSNLNISAGFSPAPTGLQVMTAASTGGAGFVGTKIFQVPALFESKLSWNAPTNAEPNGQSSFWSFNIEGLTSGTGFPSDCEMDFYESNPALADFNAPQFSIFYGPQAQPAQEIQFSTQNGFPVWYPFPKVFFNIFSLNNVAFDPGDSNFYICILNPSAGAQTAPHLDATHWALYSPASNLPSIAKTQFVDWTQQHTISILRLPYTGTDHGIVMGFLDGIWIQRSIIVYGGAGFGTINTVDNNHQTINLGTGFYPMAVDFVKVSQ